MHFEALGYPLLVDKTYGKRKAFLVSSLKRKKYNIGKHEVEKPLLSRTSLHAHRFIFDHPVTGKTLEVIAPLPKDIHAVVKQLRKWSPS